MPDLSLGVLLFIPYRHLEQRVLRAVNEAGYPITLAQARMAQRIADAGSRLTELAEAAQVTKPTAGYLVDQLEKDGYIERAADPRDARARLIRFTAKGRDVIAVATAVQQGIEQEWRDHLGEQRARALVDALVDLRQLTDPYLED
ncbi:MarR family transcriptional regulator [Terrabacter sp. NPDC000476]|uniref:MarR family winged helix-turn-helix transcriptional regulator n=1 Tax=Terrabacter sp. NPDC000476 TaxID=3154258 RepID=UPI00332B6000